MQYIRLAIFIIVTITTMYGLYHFPRLRPFLVFWVIWIVIWLLVKPNDFFLELAVNAVWNGARAGLITGAVYMFGRFCVRFVKSIPGRLRALRKGEFEND